MMPTMGGQFFVRLPAIREELPGGTVFSSTLRMVTGAANLHHVHFGRILALFAAIFAALRRRTPAGLARAFIFFPLISHLNSPP